MTCQFRVCSHSPPFRQRNWPMDDLAAAYFGTSPTQLALLNRTGAGPFQAQLYQSMVSQLLKIKSDVEQFRAGNMFGALTWQLGEVWPTGGWGVLEYSGKGQPGQLTGGRWKPLLYAMRQTIYRDQTVVCGKGSNATGGLPNCCRPCRARASLRPSAGEMIRRRETSWPRLNPSGVRVVCEI